ncbi:MAG: HisA/HisF-related TIM barrel protein [Candidatus Hodarchaeota archaeon]
MNFFKVYPVIDILNSIAVHAIKGERDKYRPLKSSIINTSEPIEIILWLKKKANLKQFYIADLDAIIHKKPSIEIIKKLLDFEDIEIIIDPGIRTTEHLKFFSDLDLSNIILGLETLQNIKIIRKSFKFFNKEKIIVSIDMYKEKLFTNIEKLKKLTPLEVINKLDKIGIKRIIILDLFRVGQKLGGIPPLYLKIKNNFFGEILVGGGIKNLEDIILYQKHNFSGVLIGTAIYDGTMNLNDLKTFCNSINKNYT